MIKVTAIDIDAKDESDLEKDLNALLQLPAWKGCRLVATFPNSKFTKVVLIFEK